MSSVGSFDEPLDSSSQQHVLPLQWQVNPSVSNLSTTSADAAHMPPRERSFFSTSPALSAIDSFLQPAIVVTPDGSRSQRASRYRPRVSRSSNGLISGPQDFLGGGAGPPGPLSVQSNTSGNASPSKPLQSPRNGDEDEDASLHERLLPHLHSLSQSQQQQHPQVHFPGIAGSTRDSVAALDGVGDAAGHPSAQKISFAYNLSWATNIVLLVAKVYAFYISRSSAVMASMVDSIVDLVSQVVIFLAEYQSKQADPRFPVGQARMEAIGVLACACIMSVSAFEVVSSAGKDLYSGLTGGEHVELDVGKVMYIVLGAATLLKAICWVVCVSLQKSSDSMLALAEDHLNDVFSNLAAIVAATIASFYPAAWYVDDVGGILISLLIVYRWIDIAKNQVDKLVGRAAPDDFIAQLQNLASSHAGGTTVVDCIRAYHFGSRFLVEMEIIMDPGSSLRHVHDTSLQLQNRLEALEEVERAFVHVDYQHREEPEHLVERLLQGLMPPVQEEV